jgi:hypothetical protein
MDKPVRLLIMLETSPSPRFTGWGVGFVKQDCQRSLCFIHKITSAESLPAQTAQFNYE